MDNQGKNLGAIVKVVPKAPVPIRLTARDEWILLFILDQKFSTLEGIYYRFFDQRKSPLEAPPKEFYTTRQRLSLLQKHGFIKKEKVYSEARSLYLLDRKGY